MGEVFAAEDRRTNRTVAIKVLRADSKQKSSAVARFNREARAAGAINSDHVTQVLNVEEDPDQGIVIVFELLEGESLIDRLKRTGPMAFEELFPIVEQVWMGLAAAHASGVIHRDLKPSNVFLERRPDGQQRVKILDFGISKLPREVGGDTLTELGQSLGTFSFMPPEQIGKAKTVDHRADIYASATLIYQAMSGQLPYAAKNILQMVDLKTKSEPRPLASVVDYRVDPRLEAFLAKGLAREPADRFQTANEALEVWRELKHPAQPAQPPPQPAQSTSKSGAGYPAVQSNRAPATMMMTDPRSFSAPSAVAPMQPRPGFSAPASPPGMDTQRQSPQAKRPGLGGTIAISSAGVPSINVPVVNDTTSEGGGDHIATVAIPVRNVAQVVAAAQARAAQAQAHPQVPRMHDDASHSSAAGTQLMSHALLRSAGVNVPVQPSRSSQGAYGNNGGFADPRSAAYPNGIPQPRGSQPGSGNMGPQQVRDEPSGGQPPVPGEGGDLTTVYRRDKSAMTMNPAVNPAASNLMNGPGSTVDQGPSRVAIILGVIAFAIVGFLIAAIAITKWQTGLFPWQ